MFVTLATEQLSAVTGVPNVNPVTEHVAVAFVVIFAGAVIVGFTLSTTLTTCVAVAVFPAPSVTVHVTVVFPNGNATGALFVTEATVQLSFVTGVPNTTPVAVHAVFVFTVIAAGATMVGFVLSTTVTTCVAVAVFPAPSVTVHVTVVFPNANTVGALFVTLATVQLSAVTGVPNATLNAAHALFAFTVTFAGAVIVGLVLSTTVTTCVAVEVKPEASVTVQVTVVLPNGNAAGALFVTLATEQLSEVTGVPKATPVAVHAVFVLTVIAAGATMVGAMLSTTVITWVAVAEFPAASITVHVTVVFPTVNTLGALLVTLATVQLSDVTGVPIAIPVAVQPVFVFTDTFAGATMVGRTVSITVIVVEHCAVVFCGSVIVYVSVLVPEVNTYPLAFVIPADVVPFGFVIDHVTVFGQFAAANVGVKLPEGEIHEHPVGIVVL